MKLPRRKFLQLAAGATLAGRSSLDQLSLQNKLNEIGRVHHTTAPAAETT